MIRHGFAYDVSRVLVFTEDEVDLLLACATRHYDGLCKRDTPRLLDWMKETWQRGLTPTARTFSFHDLDTLCKTMEVGHVLPEEQHNTALALHDELRASLREINAEYRAVMAARAGSDAPKEN